MTHKSINCEFILLLCNLDNEARSNGGMRIRIDVNGNNRQIRLILVCNVVNATYHIELSIIKSN